VIAVEDLRYEIAIARRGFFMKIVVATWLLSPPTALRGVLTGANACFAFVGPFAVCIAMRVFSIALFAGNRRNATPVSWQRWRLLSLLSASLRAEHRNAGYGN
jgi:hypothetical protein